MIFQQKNIIIYVGINFFEACSRSEGDDALQCAPPSSVIRYRNSGVQISEFLGDFLEFFE